MVRATAIFPVVVQVVVLRGRRWRGGALYTIVHFIAHSCLDSNMHGGLERFEWKAKGLLYVKMSEPPCYAQRSHQIIAQAIDSRIFKTQESTQGDLPFPSNWLSFSLNL